MKHWIFISPQSNTYVTILVSTNSIIFLISFSVLCYVLCAVGHVTHISVVDQVTHVFDFFHLFITWFFSRGWKPKNQILCHFTLYIAHSNICSADRLSNGREADNWLWISDSLATVLHVLITCSIVPRWNLMACAAVLLRHVHDWLASMNAAATLNCVADIVFFSIYDLLGAFQFSI